MKAKVRILTEKEIYKRYIHISSEKRLEPTASAIKRNEKIVVLEHSSISSFTLNDIVTNVTDELKSSFPGSQISFTGITDVSDLSDGKLYCSVKISERPHLF